MGPSPPGFAYGAITLYGPPFQGSSAARSREVSGPPQNPTSPPGYPGRIRFGLLPFPSPVLGESRLISFPPATRMFPFAGFAYAASRPPTRRGRYTAYAHGTHKGAVSGLPHSGTRGSTAACAYPRPFGACPALRRRPSRAIHRAAYPTGCCSISPAAAASPPLRGAPA